MTVILRPPGRGNWRPVVLQVAGGSRLAPLDFYVGQRVLLGGQHLRVSKVIP